MSFTVATIIAFNGERGIAETAFGEKIYFDKTAVPLDERAFLSAGAVVIYTHNENTVELASSSFSRYQTKERELYSGNTVVTAS